MEENKFTKKHRAKKSLGQNFLKSELAIKKIVEAGEIKKDDVILEIGPGKGVLTKKLLERAGLVVAVEKDKELYEFLKAKFAKEVENKKLLLVSEDILDFSFGGANIHPEKYKIIANIPYNITGAILKKFLTNSNQPEKMVLMVQHEVAQRIVARDGKESILSISVKAYGQPKMIMKVPARYFSPSPKVDSAVILVDKISRKMFRESGVSEEKFWEIVKLGFAHKRKKLSGNLKSVNFNEKLTFESLKDKRAEDLALHDWVSLSLS
jgi:16S rRNA (adenine1518-N6/adenine1519-N6)-dimethyltransferase